MADTSDVEAPWVAEMKAWLDARDAEQAGKDESQIARIDGILAQVAALEQKVAALEGGSPGPTDGPRPVVTAVIFALDETVPADLRQKIVEVAKAQLLEATPEQ